MANEINAAGLTTATRDEIRTYYEDQFRLIYGSDINVGSDTPDGQIINIFVQSVIDLQDLLVQIYNSFDPDNAIGTVLDQRVAINGIQRQAGTFTTTNITLTITGSVNIFGVDQTAQPIYTVADAAGNRWELVNTQVGATSGAFLFQSAVPGAVLTVPNTINLPITVVLGVTAINNPTTYATLGINEETDAALKIRRQISVSLASQGYLAGLRAALLNINGLTFAYIAENTGGVTDADGVPGHSIWVIVAGTGAAADIANAIYTKRNAGCGMYGAESYDVVQVDGSTFTVYWDDVASRSLFIKFTVASLDGVNAPNIAAIRSGLVTSFVPGVAAQVNINDLATDVQAIDDNTLVTSPGFSAAQVQTIALSAVAASGAFKLSYNGSESASIAWNASTGDIDTALTAVLPAGVTVVVTGSIASQSIVLTFTGVVDYLVFVSTISLLTGASAAITATVSATYTNTLTPSLKNNQFVTAAANIIILPMIMSSPESMISVVAGVVTVTSTAAAAATQTFSTIGGYGSGYRYSVVSSSGGGATIGATTGVYHAGAAGTDVIRVRDQLGNTITATITVS